DGRGGGLRSAPPAGIRRVVMHDGAGRQEAGCLASRTSVSWLTSWSGARTSTTWISPMRYSTEIFHPEFVNHYRPEGRAIPETARPASGFQAFYGALLLGFPDATVEIGEQLAERDLVATRKTLRGTHLGELWDLPPTGNRVELEFIDIFRLRDGRLIEHWTSMDLNALRQQMQPTT